MNILVDIPKLNKKQGGIYQYAVALLRTLGNQDSKFNYFVHINQPDVDIKVIVGQFDNLSFVSIQKKKQSKFTLKILRICNSALRKIGSSIRLNRSDTYDEIIKKYRIVLIHSPTQQLEERKGIPCIATMHDVQELHFPEYFTSEQRAFRAVNYKRVIDNADAIIVSYDHIKNDIVKYFQKDEKEVHTILLDMQNLWFDSLEISSPSLLGKFKLPKDFLLYPASTWEHKNHNVLINALEALKDEKISIVCTGHKTPYYHDTLKKRIENKHLQNQIKFLGIVSDEVLFELYHSCKALVIPTLYEAGSFPLMESILMGIPVICSKVTSLPETIGDDKFTFNPNNVSDVAEKIMQIWFDSDYIQENIALSKIQSQKLKNNNAGAKFESLYSKILSNN